MIEQTTDGRYPYVAEADCSRYRGVRRPRKPSSTFSPGYEVLCVVKNILERFPGVVTRKRQLMHCAEDAKTAGMTGVSLIIGIGEEARDLRDRICQLTREHEIHVTSLGEAFDNINTRTYALIWLMMDGTPVSQDVLSLTTSIRYASRHNRGTVIIGVAKSPPSVDLRLHGIDEILLQPTTTESISDKYSKWTSVQLHQEEIPAVKPEVKHKFLHITPTHNNPTALHVPGSEDLSMDRQPYSLSHDSGIQSPSTSAGKSTIQLPSIATLRKLVPSIKQETRTHTTSTADHTTKEKLRRERIKDSCDQLRVLLPYIRGRKTDMASILEMCVEYMKMIHAALPMQFQNQIVEMLTNESLEVAVEKGRRCKSDMATPTTQKQTTRTTTKPDDLPGLVTTATAASTNPGEYDVLGLPKIKRENSDLKDSMKTVKRIRLQPKEVMTTETSSPAAVSISGQAASVESQQKADHSFIDQNNNISGFYTMQQTQSHVYGDLNDSQRKFQTQDLFPAYNTTSLPPKLHCFDREAYGMYIDSHSVSHFYANSGFPGFNVMNMPEYVNPNAVLPMVSLNSNTKKESKKPGRCQTDGDL